MPDNQQALLADSIYSEGTLLELLGIGRKTLDNLRSNKDFPCVYLDRNHRVYITDDVLAWLKSRVSAGRYRH